MIRLLFAALLAPLLIGAAPAKDWTKTVSRTVEGAYIIGNPAAKVRLIEYLSYTCPHCAHYAQASTPVLQGQFIKSGSTRVELRHATRDAIDLIATIVVRCGGATKFPAMNDRVFATQEDWFPRAIQFEQSNASRIALYPENAKRKAVADASGLSDLARAQGVTDAALTACFADDAAALKLAVMSDKSWAAIRAASPERGGTPTFIVNGKPYPTLDWAGLEKVLRAAGAK